jgi:hypothetical protein
MISSQLAQGGIAVMTDRRALVFTVAALAAVSLGAGCADDEENASADVAVTRCEADPEGGRPTAEGTINNRTSKDSAYVFTVQFADPAGNTVSEGPVTVASVAAGGNAIWRTDGLARARGPLTCEPTNIERTAVP